VNDQHPNLSLPESKIQLALVINPAKKSLHTIKVFGKVISAKSQTVLYLEQNSVHRWEQLYFYGRLLMLYVQFKGKQEGKKRAS
jgi:hypothetical protein